MADTDWNLHSKQLITPADDSRMLLEPSDETAKAVEVGGFRTWLMNTALFNTLTTTVKNIIGAINEHDAEIGDIDVENDGDIAAQLNAIMQKSFIAKNSNIITVGANGCNFTTINEAITHAKTYATESNRVTILISAGLYNEELILKENNSIDLYGLGKVTVIHACIYPNAPIYVMGTCTISNIEFINNGGTDAYALHYEVVGTNITGKTVFNNCTFVSTTNAGIGCGLGQDCSVEFNNCTFNGANGTSVYLHNNIGSDVTNQNIVLNKCFSYGGIYITDASNSNGGTNSILGIYVNDCLFGGKLNYQKTNSLSYTYIPKDDSNIILNSTSTSNILGLDYDKREFLTSNYVLKPSSVTPTTSYYSYGMSLINAEKYNITINDVVVSGVGSIKDNVSIEEIHKDYINFKDTSELGAGNIVVIQLKATAK